MPCRCSALVSQSEGSGFVFVPFHLASVHQRLLHNSRTSTEQRKAQLLSVSSQHQLTHTLLQSDISEEQTSLYLKKKSIKKNSLDYIEII